jgi:hypothetical protein
MPIQRLLAVITLVMLAFEGNSLLCRLSLVLHDKSRAPAGR